MELNSNTSEEKNAYIDGRDLLLYKVEVSAKRLKFEPMKESGMPNISCSQISRSCCSIFFF